MGLVLHFCSVLHHLERTLHSIHFPLFRPVSSLTHGLYGDRDSWLWFSFTYGYTRRMYAEAEATVRVAFAPPKEKAFTHRLIKSVDWTLWKRPGRDDQQHERCVLRRRGTDEQQLRAPGTPCTPYWSARQCQPRRIIIVQTGRRRRERGVSPHTFMHR